VRSTSRTHTSCISNSKASSRAGLAEIEYLDSEGLHLIKQLCDKGDRDGTEFQFVAPPDSFARQVLEMTRMSAYIEIRDSLEG
jgi:anti-anti-sigma regulatory factor